MNQSGQITARYITPFPTDFGAANIAVAPDGTVWFDAALRTGADALLGRITPDGTVSGFSFSGLGRIFRGLVVGPDGNVWAGGLEVGAIAEIDPSGQLLATYAIPTPAASHIRSPSARTATSGFGDGAEAEVGRVTPQGTVTVVRAAAPGTAQSMIITGPGNTLWFTEGGAQPGRQARPRADRRPPPPKGRPSYTVTNTNPSGPGSLLQAITDADTANTGTAAAPDHVRFAIPADDPGHVYYNVRRHPGHVTQDAAHVAATTAHRRRHDQRHRPGLAAIAGGPSRSRSIRRSRTP